MKLIIKTLALGMSIYLMVYPVNDNSAQYTNKSLPYVRAVSAVRTIPEVVATPKPSPEKNRTDSVINKFVKTVNTRDILRQQLIAQYYQQERRIRALEMENRRLKINTISNRNITQERPLLRRDSIVAIKLPILIKDTSSTKANPNQTKRSFFEHLLNIN